MMTAAARAPLPILTSLRFFAAAEVVVFHEVYAESKLQNSVFFLRDLASAGSEAVTFFFVLSGFILTYVYSGPLEHGRIQVTSREFWKARLARILPAYFLALLVALPHFFYTAFISKITTIPDFALGFVLVPLLLQAWWPPAAMAWNTPAWSLSVELFFYACFPVLVFAAWRLSRDYFVYLAYGFVLAVAALRFYFLSTESGFDSPERNFFMFFPLFHLPQFIFGMALGRLFLFGPAASRKIHTAMFCVGIIGLILIFGGRSLLPVWTRVDPTLVLLYGLVIFGGAGAGSVLKVLELPPFILLGEASYSIYLLHMPVGWWWIWLMEGFALPGLVSFLMYAAIVIGASIASFLYVEKPLRRWFLDRREHRSA
jgi:peptidoglycan/LPS O-acetylase OafA/YrhL